MLPNQIREVDKLREGRTCSVNVYDGKVLDAVEDFRDGRIFVSAVAGEQYARAPPAFVGFVVGASGPADTGGRQFEAGGDAVLGMAVDGGVRGLSSSARGLHRLRCSRRRGRGFRGDHWLRAARSQPIPNCGGRGAVADRDEVVDNGVEVAGLYDDEGLLDGLVDERVDERTGRTLGVCR